MKLGIFVSDSPALPQPLLDRAVSFLGENGIECYIHPSAHKVVNAKDKAELIHQYLKDSSVDALMAFWGGIKTIELLPYLDFDLIEKSKKPIIGYSDTTSLLQAINSRTTAQTYHGAALISFAKKLYREDSLSSLRAALGKTYTLPQPEESNLQPHSGMDPIDAATNTPSVYKEGQSTGTSLAGNLQTLLNLSGTGYEVDLKNKILFIEDDETVNEDLLRRYLSQLTLTKDFDQLKGLVFSKFPQQSYITDETLFSIFNEYGINSFNFPVITNINSGHCDPIVTIPNNVSCSLIAKNGKVEIYFTKDQ